LSRATGNEIYEEVPPDFYDTSLKKANPLTRYYHENRYGKIRKFIGSRFRKGMRILDLGCGSSSWNITGFQVTGVDINLKMLEYGKSKGYLKDFARCDFAREPAPFEEGTFDFVVISEVLEHLTDPARAVAEARRLLKKGGHMIVTVPFDTFLSPWSVLFELGCFLRGDILGNEYYRRRCGHINHFSPKTISALIEKEGFEVIEKDITLLNIGLLAKKR
jgi:SAM-dependent methyltransferase